jgi:hypothetical protein
MVAGKGNFELFVLKKLGNDVSDSIDWNFPRLICIASDFTKYDEHAIQQIKKPLVLKSYETS